MEWPDDVVREILEHVDGPALFVCGQVCHQWKTLSENEFFQRGKTDEKKCNFTSAIQHYTGAIKLNPAFSRAYNRRGNAKYIQGDRAQAERDWTLAVNYASAEFDETMTVSEAKIIRSKIRVLEGDYDKALTEAEEAIAADVNNADAYHQRGFVRSFTGDIQGEIEDFSRCIELKKKLNPFDAYNAYNNRGLAYQDLEDWENAIKDHSEAIRLQPHYALAYKQRGKAYRCSGKLELSLSDLNQALASNPNDADALVERSYSYYELGQPAKALEDCDKAIALEPLCHDAFTVKAGLIADDGDSDGAIHILSQLLEKAPDAFVFRFRAELRVLRQDFEGAKADFEQCLLLDPRDEEARSRLDQFRQYPPPPGNVG